VRSEDKEIKAQINYKLQVQAAVTQKKQ